MAANPPREQVVYSDDEDAQPVAEDQQPITVDELEAEREKHRRRAERFKTAYVEPSSQQGPQSSPEGAQRNIHGIVTGIDLFSEEEIARRQRRSERFSTQDQSLTYQPVEIGPEEDAAERAKQQRAKRFGTEYQAPDRTGLAEADLLEQRRNPDGEDMRRPEAVHLYGVDFMSSADCLRYFGDYGAVSVEWLNDSACNVVFGDVQNAARAMVRLGRPLPPEESRPDDPVGLIGADGVDVSKLPYLWHKGEPFVKEGRSIALLFRMATIADTKANLNSRNTRYLWNLPMQQAQRKAQQQKRKLQSGKHEDGDVEMRENRGRKERGGARLARRKRRKQGLGEVEMGSAEDDADELDSNEAGGGVENVQGDAGVVDLRELLCKPQTEPGNLFSAADAGVMPRKHSDALDT